jgi:hypothetical protein
MFYRPCAFIKFICVRRWFFFDIKISSKLLKLAKKIEHYNPLEFQRSVNGTTLIISAPYAWYVRLTDKSDTTNSATENELIVHLITLPSQ